MKIPTRRPVSSLRPAVNLVGKVLPVITLLSGGCSGGAMDVSPRLDETSPQPQDADPQPVTEPESETTVPRTSAVLLVRCTEDELRVCTYYLPEHHGVRQCVVGYQVCSDNQWGQCLEGVLVDGGTPAGTGGSF